MSKEQPSMQIAFFCEINYCMSSWKPIRANVGENQNLPRTQIEMRSWICFGWAKFRNSNFVICTIASSHFSSMVNYIGPSLVAMEPQRKIDLWTFDFEWQSLRWTSFVEQMMTSIGWQFSHREKWFFFPLGGT